MLEVIPRLQWMTAFGSMNVIQTAGYYELPSDVSEQCYNTCATMEAIYLIVTTLTETNIYLC